MSWATYTAHRHHLRAVRAWERHTRKQDWTMLKWLGSPRTGYVYKWQGPPGTEATRKCITTHMSAFFLDELQKALRNFRLVMAEELDDRNVAASLSEPDVEYTVI